MRARDRWTPLGLVGASVSFVGLVAYSPAVGSLFWSPKAAVVPVLACTGVAFLGLLVWKRRATNAHLLALTFLMVAAVSTAFSSNPTIGLFGPYRLGTGLLFVAAIVGAWTIGTTLSGGDRRLLGIAIGAGLVLNLVAAVAENLLMLDSYKLFLYAKRSPGLMGNPIHIGALASAAIAATAHGGRTTLGVILTGIGGGIALQLSGSRASLLIAVVVMALTLRRERRRGLTVLAAVAIGLACGSAVASAARATSSTARLADISSSGYTARVENWWSARHAVADQPVFGSGPGTYGAAVSPYRTERLARAEAPDVLFLDAHNLIVEYAVTTGIVGILLLVTWMVLACRPVRGPFAWFGLALLAGHLVQPQFVGTTPLTFLCLGVAFDHSDLRARRPSISLIAIGAMAGVGFAVTFLAGDWMLRQSELDFTISRAESANILLPRWGVTADQLAKLNAFDEIAAGGERTFDTSLRWRREAARREPWDPHWWILLGELQLVRGEPSAARGSFERGLAENPQSTRALLGRANACLQLDDQSCVQASLAHARRVASDPGVKRTIRSIAESAAR